MMGDNIDPNFGDPQYGGTNRHKPTNSKNHDDPQVKMARNRFKSVLKHMVQETYQMQEEDSDSDDESRLYNGPGLGMPPAKRLKTGAEPVKSLPAFVMKLFDRGVDLAQFNENTPLYPICRAWIQNKPHLVRKRDTDGENDMDMEYREDTEEIYHLPPPEPLPVTEYGQIITYRIPQLLPRGDDEFNIDYDDETAPSPALLFQTHLDRWTAIRHRWKESCAFNESRYGQSFGIIKAIYDRNRPEDPNQAAQARAAIEASIKVQADEEQEPIQYIQA